MKQETTPYKVFAFICSKHNASEDNPLKIGNVEFWTEISGFPVALCYSLPVDQWNKKLVQDELNQLASPVWDELIKFLGMENN